MYPKRIGLSLWGKRGALHPFKMLWGNAGVIVFPSEDGVGDASLTAIPPRTVLGVEG